MIWVGWQSFRPENIYLGVFLVATLGALVHTSLRLVEKQVVPWKN
jgi:ABC-type nitrate/sulfonate/bicarbonate transport system permease component